MYLYQTTLFIDTTNTYGFPVTNSADKTDWETNFKSQALLINKIEIAETVFIVDKTFTQFKALIASPVLWSDVKYVESGRYNIYLLSENPL